MMGFLTGGAPGGGAGGFLTGGAGSMGGGIQELLNRLRSRTGNNSKGKGGATQPPPMVPQATGSFYQPTDTAARQQLLQAMMQRSRMGRNVGV